jgi:hypothetical protein
MAWEERNSRDYYYRKRRVNGRVVSEYVGAGEQAEQLAAEDAAERERAVARRAVQRALLAERSAVDQEVKAFAAQLQTLTRATLHAGGYHQHKGQWRRKREAR